jgi:RNA polymerase sigma factor (sigma-70 family)
LVANGERVGPTGQELLAEFQQYGHQKPFEEIVRRYAGMVFNVCLRVTKDKHDAEDAAQAVFLTLAVQAKRGTEIKALGPWLQQVGKRLALDIRRSKKRRKTREERHHEEQTHRIDSMLTDRMPGPDLDELKTILNEELQKLPTKYRLPLILHYYGGMSRDEMAVELSCKASTLGVRIFRGREMLAGRLSGRGVAITAGALAVAMGYAVRQSIADGLISSTSHAAAAIAAGHSGAGLASASVLGLTRHAGSALTAGKIKLLTMTMILAATSLGATAQAIGLLPQINVQKMLSEQIRRIVQPLFHPLNRSLLPSLRADAAAPTAKPVVAEPSSSSPVASPASFVIAAAVTKAVPAASAATVSDPAGAVPSAAAGGSLAAAPRYIAGSAPALGTSHDPSATDPADKSADTLVSLAGGFSGGTGTGPTDPADLAGHHAAASSSARPDSELVLLPVVVTSTPNGLYIPQVTKTRAEIAAEVRAAVASGAVSSTVSPVSLETAVIASPAAQVYRIPVANGSVIESDGILRGYGTIAATGTLTANGAVVADGYGVDRTLDLRHITDITSTIANNLDQGSSDGVAGWYSSDKGRLSLPLLPAPPTGRHPTLVWGADPANPTLQLANSVRMVIDDASIGSSTAAAAPAYLSLLATDRDDAPALTGIPGATIGLWQVDPSFGDVQSADLSVAFNQLLIDELGGCDESVRLWTLATGGSWNAVDSSTFQLDQVAQTVSGHADNFDYFAVSVDVPAGVDVQALMAHPLNDFGPSLAGGPPPVAVPEPAGLALVLLAAAPMLRRRRLARTSTPPS